MTSKNAAKGARWEHDVVAYLRATLGPHAVRKPRQEGFEDKGDVHVSPFALQLKDWGTASLGAWMDAATKQAVHAGERYAAVVHKRRGSGTRRGFVTMELSTFRELVWRLHRAEELLRERNPVSYQQYAHELEIESEKS